MQSLDLEPNMAHLSRVFTSALGHILSSVANFACQKPTKICNNEYVNFVAQLSPEIKDKLLHFMVRESLKYGHFYAFALPYLK